MMERNFIHFGGMGKLGEKYVGVRLKLACFLRFKVANVAESVREGAGLGHHAHLCRYETERQQQNVPTMFSIDALQKLYGTSLPPIVLARWVGTVNTISAP